VAARDDLAARRAFLETYEKGHADTQDESKHVTVLSRFVVRQQ